MTTCSFGLPPVPFVNCCQFMSLVIFLLVLRAGCGIRLYQSLIIAYCFTFPYIFVHLDMFGSFRLAYCGCALLVFPTLLFGGVRETAGASCTSS